MPEQQAAAPAVQPPEPAPLELPFDEPEVVAQELDEDLVYSYLVGEIGIRTGDLQTALVHYLHAAMLARDPYAAERATRIAIHLDDLEQGLRAARRWVELAPNSFSARQLCGVLMLRNGEPQEALQQFRAVVRIAEALDKEGLLLVAAALSSEKDHAAALEVMRGLVADHADQAQAHYALAVMETAQKRHPQAENALREAIRLQPDWDEPHVLLSRILLITGREEQAKQHLASAVAEYPRNKVLRVSYARLLVSEEAYAEALRQFGELYRRHPEDHEIRYAFAMLSSQQEKWEDARRLWQMLRNDKRYHDEATYFLGQVEESTDNPQLAIGLYRSVAPGDYRVDAVIRAAALRAENGEMALAREELAEARVANPERAEDLYLTETMVLQQSGAPSDVVLEVYATAIGAYPESNDLLYNRGLYFSEIGEYEAMEADFRAVLARDQDNAEALNALGYVLADRGVRLDEALAYILRAHKLRPDNAAILDSLGWAYYRKGDYALALRYLRDAVAADVDDEIAAHLGEVLWVTGQRDEAQSVWSEALEATPESRHLRAVMERFLSQPE